MFLSHPLHVSLLSISMQPEGIRREKTQNSLICTEGKCLMYCCLEKNWKEGWILHFQRETTFLCKLCPVFNSLMLTTVLYSMGTCILQLSTSGGNGRGNVMFLSPSSQCWQLLRFPDWPKRGKKICSDSHQPALPIVSLKESPRVTDTKTCEHQPFSVLLFSIEQWQWLHHLICFSQFWFCCVPFYLHVLGECCEFHFIAVSCVHFVPGAFHLYNYYSCTNDKYFSPQMM